MKKGKSKQEQKGKAPVTSTPEDTKPSSKMLKFQKKMGKIEKWNLSNTTAVNITAISGGETTESPTKQGDDKSQTMEIPKINLVN